MPAGSDIRLIEARRGGRLIGLLPFEIVRGYARLPVLVVQNWCHDHAFLGTPLVAAGEEEAFWAAAIDALNAADLPANLIHLWRMSETLVPIRHAFDFNQALMDLGAMICVARNPKCVVCPLAKGCSAFPFTPRKQ